MKLRKGDEVVVLRGKDAGKKGKIDKVFKKEGKVLITGVNLYKRHLKPRGQGKPGGIIDITKPLPASNVAMICPRCNQKTRIGYSIFGSEKARICRRCKEKI